MKEMTALRLFFPQSAKARPTRFWHRLSAPTLSHRLLQAARHAGIEQVLMHPVQSGYLPGRKLSHGNIEATPGHHPFCIELIDMEERLRAFLQEHAGELRHVRAVLYRCELAI